MKLFYQFMAIFVNFLPTSSDLQPPQVGNCDRNSRLAVDEDDNGKSRLDRVKAPHYTIYSETQLQVGKKYMYQYNLKKYIYVTIWKYCL